MAWRLAHLIRPGVLRHRVRNRERARSKDDRGRGKTGKPEEQRAEPSRADDDLTKFRKHGGCVKLQSGTTATGFQKQGSGDGDGCEEVLGWIICPLRYSAVDSFLRLRYSALSTHTHARITTASIHAARATLSGLTPSPSESQTTTQELKKRGILYNSS